MRCLKALQNTVFSQDDFTQTFFFNVYGKDRIDELIVANTCFCKEFATSDDCASIIVGNRRCLNVVIIIIVFFVVVVGVHNM